MKALAGDQDDRRIGLIGSVCGDLSDETHAIDRKVIHEGHRVGRRGDQVKQDFDISAGTPRC
ncbi:hypothetical protein [Dyella silvatica]|uniref:hypothetical protein n=1 Tax=Dyella silvatica TaxID=2992128 RepID=UPI0022555AD5|nr:hypothetical protein [Dyella silvatica]